MIHRFPCGLSLRTPWLASRPAAAAVAATVFLVGCATTPFVPTDVATTGMPNPEVALRDSIRLVDGEMTELGTLSRAPWRRAGDLIVPDELNKIVTFAYAGPLDDGVRKLADAVGYRMEVTPAPPPAAGQPPLAPLTVSVSTGFVPAIEAFVAIGDAAGDRALVRVDPLRHLVEVVHHA